MVCHWSCPRPAILVPIALCGAILILFARVAHAQTLTWDGGGADNNWSTAGNWSSDNNAPDTAGEAALFTDDPVGQTKLAPNLSADVTIGQLRYSATAPSYGITGPSTLFLNPTASYSGVGIIAASGAANQAITAVEVEFLASQIWDIGGTTVLTVSGTIEDDSMIDYGLTKNGTGTVVFPGDVRYDGPTIVNSGALILSFMNGNTSMLSALSVNGGILRGTTNANVLGNNATRNAITLNGGALELANDTGLTFGQSTRRTTVTGNTTLRSDRLTSGAGVTHTLGTLSLGSQILSVAPGAFVNSGTAGLTFGATTFSTNGAVFNVAIGANLTLAALGGNFTFAKQGGGALTLNTAANANRTNAGVTLSSGTLKLGNASTLGAVGVPLTLNGGTLDLAINSSVNAHNTTIAGNATIVSDRSTGGAGVIHTLGTLAIGMQILSLTPGTNATSGTAVTSFGTTTLSGNATFDVVNSASANSQLTFGGVGESGGARSLTKTGNGTLLLNGVGGYTGGTTLSQGSITLGVANALGSGGFTFAGGTLNANNSTDGTIGALTLTASSKLNLSPGGASATLTFAGVSGAANGILTITGWSGLPGGLGSDDKIIFSGGATPDAAYLQHIRFDLGDGNSYSAALGAGGEIFPSAAPTPTPSPTQTPTTTPSPTETPTPSPTETPAPSATEAPTATPSATATQTPTPATITISGNVSHCSSSSAAPVADVTLSLTGENTISITTDSSGNYQFSALPSGGSYIVSVVKPALLPGSSEINTLDVVATQRQFLNIVPLPPGCQLDAADANGDAEINTIDVVAIQRFFLGLTTATANVGKYRFTPPSRAYPGITTDQTQENYDALVFGDVAFPFADQLEHW